MKTFGELDEIQSLENDSVLAANNPTDTMSNKIKFVNLKSQILGNIVNTGDSSTPTQNGTEKFTTGGAYILKEDIDKAYKTDDTTENNIEDSDYIPFYDNSTTSKKKTLWSNIKSKLKTYFDNHYPDSQITSPQNGDMLVYNSNDDKWENQQVSYTASDVGAIPATQKGANNGVAELDSTGKVPSSQLPSFVDDVLEYTSISEFPTTGETGKIYVDTTTNKTYRWSGTAYVEISASLALGETSSTAYRGDRGKTAYDHSQITSGNPHNVTKSDVGLSNVGNFKAVSTVASQGLSDTEKSNARANIGAGTSSLALGTSSSTAFRGDYGNSAYTHAVTNKGSAFTSGLYKITTNSEGHVTAATAVAKADITGLGIPASDTDTKNTAGSTDTSSKIFLVGATSQAANPQTYSDNEVYTTSGVLSSKKLSTKALVALTGSGTAGSDKGSGVSPRYIPTLWTFNSGVTVANGEIYFIKIPTAGGTYGVWLSLNNGTNYYPVAISTGKNRFTTHYAANTVIAVTYESAGVCTCYAKAGADATADVTGIFRVLNDYDANTTYSSKAAASGGTATSLVTTGEKYLWNQMLRRYSTSWVYNIKITFGTGSGAVAVLYCPSGHIILSSSGSNLTIQDVYLRDINAWTYSRSGLTVTLNCTNHTPCFVYTSNNDLTCTFTDTSTPQSTSLSSLGIESIGAHLNNIRSSWICTCSTAASEQVKVAITDNSGFLNKLIYGMRIAVKFTNSNTYSATTSAPCKLKLNDTDEKPIYYNNTGTPTGTNTKAFGYANRYNYYTFDGTYWVWDGCGTDDNTTYSAMSSSELTTGTATTSRVVRADYLKAGIQSMIDASVGAAISASY